MRIAVNQGGYMPSNIGHSFTTSYSVANADATAV